MSERSLTNSRGSGQSLGSGGVSPRRSPIPSRVLSEKFGVHYVGSAPLGPFDTRLLNMSGLQKPLYNIYLEYLKTGGGNQKRQREVLFTELGVKVLREEAGATKEVFLDYGTLLYWDSVMLRSFKSAGKKMYGMFESLRSDYRSMVNKPDTLFPMDKKCVAQTMPAAPLVTFVNRPNPNQRELDCHALAFISAEQAVDFVTTLASRTKSYYEDYGTLAVDDVLFTPNDKVKTDFNKWKLTEEGWRLTSEPQSNDKNQITKSRSEFIFENFPPTASSSGASSENSPERKQQQAMPPLNYNANWRKPIRGRTASENSGKSKSFSESKMRSASESQSRYVSDPDEMYEYEHSPEASSPHGSQSGARSSRIREASPPIDYNDNDCGASQESAINPAPKKIPFHQKNGIKVLPTIEPLKNTSGDAKPSLNRSQSDIGYVSMRTLPDEQPGSSGCSRYPIREHDDVFESTNNHHHGKVKDKEIDSDLRNTVYLEGLDDDERSVSRTDFEQCLGYLP
ncbi:uncharacterized protein LOC135503592 [Lineus longissimus]|uniref:uncharacterized protein LOC135503592 n=1 Tax=Lineus longissimus TaxID=88925 RepID=UPI002B4CDFDF